MRSVKQLFILTLLLFPLSATSLPGLCISNIGLDTKRIEIIRLADAIYRKFQVPWSYAQKIVSTVYENTKTTTVTPVDVLAVISVESEFRESAVHRIGPSIGLMQINVLHHRVPDLKKPEVNIKTGIRILEEYREDRSFSYTLVAYNAGPRNAKRICSSGNSCETAYTKKVHRAKAWLETAKKGGFKT